MVASTLVPVGSLESVFSVVGVLELVFCLVLVIASIVKKKAFGVITCISLLALGAAWVGLERGNSYVGDDGGHPFKASKGWEILWRWSDGTYNDAPQWGWDCSESTMAESKKERYYSMHINGGVSPQFFHPDSLWVAPLIGVVLAFIITPQLWPVWYLLLNWALSHDD